MGSFFVTEGDGQRKKLPREEQVHIINWNYIHVHMYLRQI